MQMQIKVIKLELFYNSALTSLYLHDVRYLAPFAAETAEHFCRRLLSYCSLYELHPALSVQAQKGPDLFVRDQHQHYQLWCQVDPPSDKQLQKASHQSDQVILMLEPQDHQRFVSSHRRLPNVQVCDVPDAAVSECMAMLKANMQLSVWREEQLLQITDGEHMLELALPQLHRAVH